MNWLLENKFVPWEEIPSERIRKTIQLIFGGYDMSYIWACIREKEVVYEGEPYLKTYLRVAFIAIENQDRTDLHDLVCIGLGPNVIRFPNEKDELDEIYKEFFELVQDYYNNTTKGVLN